MAFTDLHQFVEFLDRNHQLQRIKASVDPVLELAEITDRVCKADGGGTALLFEHVQGSSMPVLINTFGSEERMCWALGVDSLDDLGARISHLLSMNMPTSFMERAKKLLEMSEVARFSPKVVSQAPCQELVETVNPSLADLPIMQCWPNDGGRYITFPLVFTKNPSTGQRNVGTYRLQVYDDRTLGMHWHIHKGGAEHFRQGQERGRGLEVAIALGADPVTMYAGTCPLPPIVDEMMLAGWLRRERVEMVKGVTVELEVPAHAEIILEGYVDPGRASHRGPIRRPHRLLLIGGRIPCLPSDRGHQTPRCHLPVDHCWTSAHGGRLAGKGYGTALSAADTVNPSRSGGHRHAL